MLQNIEYHLNLYGWFGAKLDKLILNSRTRDQLAREMNHDEPLALSKVNLPPYELIVEIDENMPDGKFDFWHQPGKDNR